MERVKLTAPLISVPPLRSTVTVWPVILLTLKVPLRPLTTAAAVVAPLLKLKFPAVLPPPAKATTILPLPGMGLLAGTVKKIFAFSLAPATAAAGPVLYP
ncbi:MAG TPA: hypothetical protein VJ417_04390, partial [Candidatus Glassbacteria bacterium]|nr:hypothetical protein [Candidatus Glassbacteria bacterium]